MSFYNLISGLFLMAALGFGPAAFAQNAAMGVESPVAAVDLQTKRVSLSFADAADLLEVLNQMKSPPGNVVAEGEKTVVLTDNPSQIGAMERIIKELDVQRFTMVFELSHAKAGELSGKVQEMLTKGVGKVKFDERSNKLIVTDTSAKIEEIRHLVDAIDQRDRQVLIDARIVQITLNDEHRTGVDWEAIISNYRGLILGGALGNLPAGEKRSKLSIGTLSHDDYLVLLEALDTVGKVDILSNLSITAVNNKESRVLGGAPTGDNVNPFDAGLKIFVTPTVHSDGFVAMKIRPEVNAVTAQAGEKSDTEATINAKDGITMVIGGLIKEEKVKVVKKVPILGDVPFLGVAFRSHNRTVKKTETVIFLTPRVSTGDAVASVIQGKK